MKILSLCVLALLLTGCTRYAWTKADTSQQETSRDSDICLRDATTAAGPIPSAGTSLTLPMSGSSSSSVASAMIQQQQAEALNAQQGPLQLYESTRQNLYRACMESKGYLWQPQP